MTLRSLATLAAFACLIQAQNQPPNASPASPGASLTARLVEADRLRAVGKFDEAIAICNEALERTHEIPAIQVREEEVLQHLSATYIQAQRPKEAVKASMAILRLHKNDCVPESPRLESCADAQYGLGLSMMHASEFAEAATQLTEAVANFGRIAEASDAATRSVKVRHRGDAENLLAAAIFRAGDKDKAITAFRKAVATLNSVANDEKADPATRNGARTSLQDAQTSLDMLVKAQ